MRIPFLYDNNIGGDFLRHKVQRIKTIVDFLSQKMMMNHSDMGHNDLHYSQILLKTQFYFPVSIE